MANNIEYLWKQIEDKKEARNSLSDITGVSPINIRNNWLSPSNYYYTPKKYEKDITTLLQTIIKIQNENKTL